MLLIRSFKATLPRVVRCIDDGEIHALAPSHVFSRSRLDSLAPTVLRLVGAPLISLSSRPGLLLRKLRSFVRSQDTVDLMAQEISGTPGNQVLTSDEANGVQVW